MAVYSTDIEVLQTAIDWLQQRHCVALVTVVKTWGSSPRPAGSMLVMREDGVHAGSVSGGCVEQDLTARYQNNEISDYYPNLINYGIDRQDALRFGLPCGGRLELMIEQPESAEQLNALLQRINHGELVTRRVCMNTGEISLHKTTGVEDFKFNNNEMLKVFGSRWHMLLIGAGHLSEYVASIALMLNYKVTVCDPREQYQSTWKMENVTFTSAMPDDAVMELNNPGRSIIVTLAHDPKLDDMALITALQNGFFYVGALGSKRSNKQRLQRLREMGVSPAQLKKLHAPVGLDIGSHTPPEIAVAIMAEITALRNGVRWSAKQSMDSVAQV